MSEEKFDPLGVPARRHLAPRKTICAQPDS
jgi:hypothetical protein